MTNAIQIVLKDFVAMIGLPVDDASRDNELLSLLVDDKITIHIGERPEGRLVICTALGPVSKERAMFLLSTNVFDNECHPITFAYDSTLNEGIAWCRLPEGIDAGGIYRHFHQFITAIEALPAADASLPSQTPHAADDKPKDRPALNPLLAFGSRRV